MADDADHLALLDGKAHVVERLEQGARLDGAAQQPRACIQHRLLQALQRAQLVFLGQVLDFNDGHGVR